MYPFVSRLTSAALVALALPTAVSAGANQGWNNIAVYWGQNSAGGASTQGRLAEYCSNTPVNIIPLAFMNGIRNPATVNFGSASDVCSKFSGTSLLDCPQIEEDIIKCQELGKIILLSIGGATYSEGGFDTELSAQGYADKVWAMFGPKDPKIDVPRPFGKAVVDGFDFDFESPASNLVAFGQRLRDNMDAAAGTYYLSTAPQCPYPDAAVGDMLAGAVAFDFVMVQFYNNYCGVQAFDAASGSAQKSFNFDTWDHWAQTGSKNKNVKVLLGVPAAQSAAGSGYIGVDELAGVIDYCKRFDSFGGVMMWDMSQLYQNKGFLSGVESALQGGKSPDSTTAWESTTTTTTTSTTTEDVTKTASGPTETVTTTSASVAAEPTTLKTSTRRTSSSAAPSTFSSSSSTSSSSSSASATWLSSSTTTSSATSTTSSSAPTTTHQNWNSGSGNKWEVQDVPQYNQCGGRGWQGLTKCRGSMQCVCKNEWFCMCE
ncbi:hypothetical protein TD95_005140 [Thielaviopsis punctulata]|uniref:chitinase n=1 Tax=Thielaviopsis punctulata TaxID=72032 RepID=A0A0F4ZJJ6_9PEZI|nr:hypothetical protein TD95_005140 [Thielaviopsis punctulata]